MFYSYRLSSSSECVNTQYLACWSSWAVNQDESPWPCFGRFLEHQNVRPLRSLLPFTLHREASVTALWLFPLLYFDNLLSPEVHPFSAWALMSTEEKCSSLNFAFHIQLPEIGYILRKNRQPGFVWLAPAVQKTVKRDSETMESS